MTTYWLDRTRQRWKVRAAYVLSPIQIGALIDLFVAPEAPRFVWVFFGETIAVALLWVLVLSVRCRVCGEFVMYRVWKDPGNSIRRLSNLQACPDCGARGNELSSLREA
jgi:predicted RNA-binding Zn-ribbon protein involved in translation (DUF1610 family)